MRRETRVGGARLPVPEGTPERFLLYLSGSDTFGDISTLSRSDVNILAAVDTRAKRLLLVATPRDFYVSFSQTGGAKDKLTHAAFTASRLGGRPGDPIWGGD